MQPKLLPFYCRYDNTGRLKEQIVSQFRHPRGKLGAMVGWLMAIKNRDRIRQVVTQLNIQSNDYILEVGYGPGVAISEAAKRAPTGHVVGIDISREMHRQAQKRNQKHIVNGRVALYHGTLQDLPKTAQGLDKAFAINTTMFWKDPVSDLGIIHKRLKTGGKITLALQPHWAKTEKDLEHESQEIVCQLQAAHFQNISLIHLPTSSVPCLYAEGTR